MTKVADSSGFWRCGRCGTPNLDSAFVRNCVACGTPRSLVAQEIQTPALPTTSAVVPGSVRSPGAGSSRILLRLSIAYLLLVLLVLALIKFLGGIWWPAAFLLLGPRWVWLLPGLPLIGWASWKKQRASKVILVFSFILVAGPTMGLNLPWGGLLSGSHAGTAAVRVLSLNRAGSPIDVARLINYIERNQIDVLCFQEIGKDPVLDDYLAHGWHREKDGYLASRHPIIEEIPPPPENNADQERYTMSVRRLKVRRADGVEFLIASIHMPTLSRGLNGGIGIGFRPNRFQAHLDWWSKEFGRLIETLSDRQDAPLLVAGDLNMPSDHPILRALKRAEVFQSAFEERGWGYGYTMPSKMPWIRIDHVLTSREWEVQRCWIGPDFGSDHKSIIAELTLPGTGVP